jgi:cytochrome c oxidase assembly protein subunit 15
MIVSMDRLSRFSRLVLACNVAVILWGAVVRATGSGAGCGSHWPLCNGEVMPRAPRLATVIELSHRLTSGLALVLVLALAAAAFAWRPKGDPARKAAVAAGLLMLSEAAVGAGLVLFRLVADNQSMARAMFMGTHLVNTFFLLGALTLTAWFAGGGAPPRLRGDGRKGWLVWGLALGVLGLLLAGVSGAVAALGDTLFPARSLAQALGQDFSTTGHLLIRLRLLHPAIAVAAGLWALFLTVQAGEKSRWGRWTGACVLLQWIAGAVNVALLAPVWMQVVHLLVADLLWIAFVLFAASALAVRTAREPDAGVVELVEVRGES